MIISFIYNHLGAEYDVLATFTPGKFPASMSGPHDDEPTLEDMEIIGPDGSDWSGEMKDIFTRDRSASLLRIILISIHGLIEEEAFDQYESERETS